MISQTLEYALRAIVAVAQRGGQPSSARQISDNTEIPLPYLSKLMQSLAKAEIVKSQRGVRGGFVLGRSPQELTIWDIVEVVDPIQRIVHCPLKISSHGTTLCPLHRRIDDALAATEKLFRETRVSELLQREGGLKPLCESG